MENKETGRTDLPLMKLVLRLGVTAMLNAMLIFTAIPHIFFGFGGTADANIAQMTRQAMSIGGVCMSLQEFENTVLDSIITGIVAGYLERGTEINRISVVNEFNEESLQWMTAINATAHQQNLNEITVDEIRELCTARLSFSFSLFQEEDAVLQITIHKLDPDEWMDKLGFDKEARTWAGAIFETFSESGAMEKYGDYYADAGHEKLLLYQDGAWHLLPKETIGPALAMWAPEDFAFMTEEYRYRDKTIQLRPGDAIFQYTDGVTEAMPANHELFGEERLLDAMNSAPSTQPEDLLAYVRARIDEFVKGAAQFDDITMLGLQYKGRE